MRAALVFLLVGCSAAPSGFPVPARVAEMPRATAVSRWAGTHAVTLAAPSKFGRVGRARIIRSGCRPADPVMGSPVVIVDGFPTAGRPFRVLWTVNPTAPYDADRPAMLLVSIGPAESVRLDPVGMPGCVLSVGTSPDRLFSVLPRVGTPLTQDGGRVWLHWTPPAEFAGLEVRLQLAVVSPGQTDTGWLLSPAVELWIGSGAG